MTNPTIKFVFKALAVSLVGTGIAFGANAASMDEKVKATFELDTRQPAHVIHAAWRDVAKEACEPDRPALIRLVSKETQICASGLLDKAVAKADFPELTAYHTSRSATAKRAAE